MQWNLTQVFVSNKQLCTPPEGALTANRGRHCLFCNKKKECLLKFLPLQYFRNNMPPMRINLCIPWCVIDKGFSAVQGKIVGLELFTGGHARPSLFCGSACYKEKRVNQSTVVCSVQRRTHIKSGMIYRTRVDSAWVPPRTRNMRWSSSSTVDPGKRGLPVIIS